jgi:hypothetical protein
MNSGLNASPLVREQRLTDHMFKRRPEPEPLIGSEASK